MNVPTKSEMCVCVSVYEATKKQTWQHSGWHWLGLRLITVTVECNFHIFFLFFPETFSILKEIYFPWNELSHKYLIKVCTFILRSKKGKSACVYPLQPRSRRPASPNACARLPSVECGSFTDLRRFPAALLHLRDVGVFSPMITKAEDRPLWPTNIGIQSDDRVQKPSVWLSPPQVIPFLEAIHSCLF